MLPYLPLLLVAAVAIFSISTLAISGVDETCVSACSDWSVVMGFCRGSYSDYSQQNNIDYTNAFLACLCKGSTSAGEIGNVTISESTGTCLGCKTTPGRIKKDLDLFLTLCAVQASNGTATNATLFMPISYSTSEDTSKNGMKVSAASSRLATITGPGLLSLMGGVAWGYMGIGMLYAGVGVGLML
ncbi:hypothetical protein I317_06921 [Kwoniella heveanensis CBS 569]|nr:hypothetical protein I317_06921 [Kwoniella heveanensis CBS 569]